MSFERLIAALVALAITVSASGCGRSASETSKAGRVRVAAAADLKFAFGEVLQEFATEHPDIRIDVIYGSSGNFYTQLINRAPLDIYFSADMAYPRRLVDQGLADPDSEFLYAVGQIVVWVPTQSTIDVEPNLVLGENIAQTAQFVDSGAADIGIIALSLAVAPAMQDKGRYYMIPLDSYATMEQGSVILNWAKDREATQRLRDFVAGPRGRGILQRYGFILPGE